MKKQYQTYLKAIEKAKEKFPEIKALTYEEYLGEGLAEAKKHVRNAVIAVCISAVVTIAFIILGWSNINYYSFIDVIMLLALAYGISKYNKTCGVLLLVYSTANYLYRLPQLLKGLTDGTANIFTILVGIGFLAYFYLGVIGIFTYHTIIGEIKTNKDKADKNIVKKN